MLKPSLWFPVAVAGAVINVVGAAFAMAPLHITAHAVLAVAFGLWAQRLRQRAADTTQLPAETGATPQLQAGFEALEAEVFRMRQELAETQERVDFVERMLTKEQEARRVNPQR